MELTYKHYFRDPYSVSPTFVEVEEPIGWDAVELTTQRSNLFIGLENEYSDNLTWDKQGGVLLTEWFGQYSFDGLIDYKIEEYCNGVLSISKVYVINFITYKSVNNEVTVKVEDSVMSRKIKNRIDTPINFQSEVSIEGVELTPLDPFSLNLHSKTIRKKSQSKANEFLLNESINWTFGSSGTFTRIEFPYDVVASELDTLYGSTNMFNVGAPSIADDPGTGKFVVGQEGDPIEVEYNLKGIFRHYNAAGNITYTYSVGYMYGGTTVLLYTENINYTGGFLQQRTFDYQGSFNADLVVGQVIVFFVAISNYINVNTSPLPTTFDLLTDISSGVTYTQNTTSKPTKTDAYYIYESLNRCVESMTDRTDAIRSEFFGRLNSSPTTYDSNGCGSFLANTDGKNIRNLLDVNGNKYPVTISFQELYEALDVIYSLGMRVETIGGIEYLRIEPKEYFYSTNTVMQFKNVADIERTVAVDLIYNEFEIGYQDWEVETVNGIDEFNTKHIRAIPVRNAKNRLTKVSKMIAGGFAIETTRRLQNKVAPTTDYQYDNNNFLICLNRTDQTFDSLETDPYKQAFAYPHTYDAYTCSERNEAFLTVDNVLSPETSYNLRLSPTRCAYSWYPWIGATIAHAPSTEIKHQSGEGNYQLTTELSDSCESARGLIKENESLVSTKASLYKARALFKPEYLRFEFPLTLADYQYLRYSSNRAIEVSCSDEDFEKAFLKEIKYLPNSGDGGIVSILAIAGLCTLGSFDQSFDTSFDIGTC